MWNHISWFGTYTELASDRPYPCVCLTPTWLPCARNVNAPVPPRLAGQSEANRLYTSLMWKTHCSEIAGLCKFYKHCERYRGKLSSELGPNNLQILQHPSTQEPKIPTNSPTPKPGTKSQTSQGIFSTEPESGCCTCRRSWVAVLPSPSHTQSHAPGAHAECYATSHTSI